MNVRNTGWKHRIKQLRGELIVLYLACRDPRVPWYAKIMALAVIGYAASPIDLIPDFIPILGYLDDLVLLPLGIYLTMRWIPREVLEEYRHKMAQETTIPRNWYAGAVIILIWICLTFWAAGLLLRRAGVRLPV